MECRYMTDHQYDSILEMVDMVLDGCRDLQEAHEKLRKLRRSGKPEELPEDGRSKEDS